MTREEANFKAGQNQHLIESVYKTSAGEILKVDSVMLWDVGNGNFEAHAFFMEQEEELFSHINIDLLIPPTYNKIA